MSPIWQKVPGTNETVTCRYIIVKESRKFTRRSVAVKCTANEERISIKRNQKMILSRIGTCTSTYSRTYISVS